MLEVATNVDVTGLIERIDELSTRLILDGVATLGPLDFERLSQMAGELGVARVETAARRTAESIASTPTSSIPALTGLVSSALVELRGLMDDPHPDSPDTLLVSASARDDAVRLDALVETRETNSLAGDEDLIREFITESGEHLATIERQLLVLEKDNSATETLNAIFRGFHTIKGLAGFLEFAEIQSLTHEVETLLDLARTSQLTVTPGIVDVVLESTDIVRHQLSAIAQKLAGETPEPTQVGAALLERIRQAARGQDPDREPDVAAFLPVGAPALSQNSPASLPNAVSLPGRRSSDAEAGLAVEPQRQGRRAGDSSSVRIDTAKLDQLMDMVGEMVIAQTLIRHSPVLAAVKNAILQGNLTQLARITADVQRIATGMRMVPIGMQFQKTARLVRDLARRAGKQILFEASGEDTELDKTIAEELSDPLLHMVRNSIDHGIESTEERMALG